MTNVVPIGQQPETLENVEAEQLLLGAMMFDNSIIADIAGTVSAEDFSEPAHSIAFGGIVAEHCAGRAVNPVLLKPYYEGFDLAPLGGLGYLARLSGNADGLLVAPELADQIHDLGVRRRLRGNLTRALQNVIDLTCPSADIVDFSLDVTEELSGGGTFELLTIDALRKLPPPDWLVHETVVSDGLTIIYGEPGAGKSFIALDMALRIAQGRDWHGLRTKRAGVLYIAGEGVRGVGKRVEGWAMHHRTDLSNIPFVVMPVAAQILEPAERAKLIRTIDEAKRQLNFEIGLTIVDTVSRSIAGFDENGQETMSAFVKGCDEIKAHTGGAMIGIHHSGKDKERGMRGSTVLLGACDAAIRLTKDAGLVTLTFEKQKDAEEQRPIYFSLEQCAWNTGTPDRHGLDLTTLVPIRTDAPNNNSTITMEQIAQAMGMMVDAWAERKPLSSKAQTRDSGRYAPAVFARNIGGDASDWKGLLVGWLETGTVVFDVLDRKNHISGLRVIDAIA